MIVNKQSIENIFHQIESDGIQITENTNWNFYFFDKSLKKIKRLEKSFLNKKEDYNTLLSEMEDGYWRLTVSIKKLFNSESLYKNNVTFNYLINDYDIELFDGWDVDV